MTPKSRELQSNLLARGLELYATQPDTFEVPVDITAGQPTVWAEFPNGIETASYDAVEETGRVDIKESLQTIALINALGTRIQEFLEDYEPNPLNTVDANR